MGSYNHKIDSSDAALPLGKIVCVGRNFAEHVRELENKILDEPILFLKPSTSLSSFSEQITIYKSFGACHFETELSLLIGKKLTGCSKREAVNAIAGIGLSLDLTYRDLQKELKSQGLPWEKAKAFDNACPTSTFISANKFYDLDNISFKMHKNGQIQQSANTSNMIWKIAELICYASKFFTFLPGDIFLTGTPSGVGALQNNDTLLAEIPGFLEVSTTVAVK